MEINIKRILLLIAILFTFSANINLFADDFVAIPNLTGRIVDQANILSEEEKSHIESKLKNFEQQKGAQIAVLTVASTKPEEIEQFSIRLAEAWKIGRENLNDGVILVIAFSDRAFRLEVGYGLEGILPDARAKQILETYLKPNLIQQNYFKAIDQTVDSLIATINQEELPPPPEEPKDIGGIFFFLIIMGLVVASFLSNFIKQNKAALIASGLTSVIGFILSIAPLGIIAAIIVFIFASMASPAGFHRSSGRSGGGWSSGGSSSGGFSGGGGSFGGGGASGRW